MRNLGSLFQLLESLGSTLAGIARPTSQQAADPIRKAALLLSMVPEELADRLLQSCRSVPANRLSTQLLEDLPATADELREVYQELLQAIAQSEAAAVAVASGLEAADETVAEREVPADDASETMTPRESIMRVDPASRPAPHISLGPNTAPPEITTTSRPAVDRLTALLAGLNAETLAELLRPERPQLIAAVLGQTTPRMTAAVLAQLTPAQQREVTRQLAAGAELSATVSEELAVALGERLATVTARPQAAPLFDLIR